MLRRLSLTLKDQKDVNREVRGAAVPYHEPTSTDDDDNDVDDDDISTSASPRSDVLSWPSTPSTPTSPGRALSPPPLVLSARTLLWSSGSGSSSPPAVYLPQCRGVGVQRQSLAVLAETGDADGLKAVLKVDASSVNDIDENGDTALHKAARHGHSRAVRCLLMHAASVDTTNARGHNALYVALESGHVGVVALLIDFMYALDNKPRDPFVLVRAHVAASQVNSGAEFVVDSWSSCVDVGSLSRRRVDYVQLLVCHSQKSHQLTTFLSSDLDVPVCHAFFVHGVAGHLGLRKFRRLDERHWIESITVLNTHIRSLPDIGGFRQLRSLILVDCGISQLPLDGVECLETLDVRRNRLRVVPLSVGQCRRLRTVRVSHNVLRQLPSELGQLDSLTTLDCAFNHLKRLTGHLVRCTQLRCLQCNDNRLVELPVDIGLLTSLEDLRVNNNKLSQLPVSVSALSRLRRISFASNPLINIPADFPERAADVRQYLSSLQEDPVVNSTVKLVVVGQEGVGKTSLLKAIKRTFWIVPHGSTSSTDGVDVRDMELNGVTLRCVDCGGDVDVTETHNLFISRGALYLACFNLSEFCLATVERHSFVFGRLQLWLQYIFCKVPDAQVIIVGTHVDHSALSRTTLEQIWHELRELLCEARDHHQRYFSHADRLPGCLLCQTDPRCTRDSDLPTVSDPSDVSTDQNGVSTDQTEVSTDESQVDAEPSQTGAWFVNHAFDAGDAATTQRSDVNDVATQSDNDDDDDDDDETSLSNGIGNDDTDAKRTVMFPHVVGYYEVSCTSRSQGIGHLRDAVTELASQLIGSNPDIPRRWLNVERSLVSRTERSGSVCTLDELKDIASVQGVNNPQEVLNMIHFFRAQGRILYFPQLADLDELVILDPEWLARVFTSVVTSLDCSSDDHGLIERGKLQLTSTLHCSSERLVALLRYFQLCLPVDGTDLELFPCRLPVGQPDHTVWPPAPRQHDRQVTYRAVFPAIIPPPFFNSLIATVYSYRATAPPLAENDVKWPGTCCQRPQYFANEIVEWIRVDRVGCVDCGTLRGDADEMASQQSLYHCVLIELSAQTRVIQVTARGSLPCCVMKKLCRIFSRVVRQFDGLGNVELDRVVCPGCVVSQRAAGSSTVTPSPQDCFHVRRLRHVAHRKSSRSSSLSSSSSSSVAVAPAAVISASEQRLCRNGHVTGSNTHLLCGILSNSYWSTAEVDSMSVDSRSRRRSNDVDTDCPRLFILLPVNKDGLTLDDDLHVLTSTVVYDGYAVHLLCEFPDGYHVTSSPGYRLRRPREFFERYGGHVAVVLGLLSRLASSSAVSVQYAVRTRAVVRLADALISDLAGRFPAVKPAAAVGTRASTDQLVCAVDQSAAVTRLRRDDLRCFLRLADDRADSFGPLHRLLYDRISQDGSAHSLWLCDDHFRLMCGGVVPALNLNKNMIDACMY